METFIYVFIRKRIEGSYPTYEEWKHFINKNLFIIYISSYPTYEEWKPEYLMSLSEEEEKGSYPTYEEWKLNSSL